LGGMFASMKASARVWASCADLLKDEAIRTIFAGDTGHYEDVCANMPFGMREGSPRGIVTTTSASGAAYQAVAQIAFRRQRDPGRSGPPVQREPGDHIKASTIGRSVLRCRGLRRANAIEPICTAAI
jgi:hypothetical protein